MVHKGGNKEVQMSEGVLEANGGLPGQYIDGIIDIIGESHNVQMYYQNEILRQILFNKNELTSEQMRELIYSYGNSLHAKDTIGRRVFVKLAMSGYTHWICLIKWSESYRKKRLLFDHFSWVKEYKVLYFLRII